MNYKPNPVDTSDVQLSSDLERLIELVAENVHERWAKGRMEDGWVYGEERDDDHKKTPCLVPYDQLPESEKDYDRLTATETIKLIIKLGYTIDKD